MLNKFVRLIGVCGFMLAAVGCSSKKDLFEPVESPEIINHFDVGSQWSRSTQGANGKYSQLAPCIYGDKLYVAGRAGKVYAFDAATGNSVWTKDLDDEEENDNKRSARLNGGVTASSTYVAVGSENGYVYVLNRSDGNVFFKYYIGAEILSAPAFSADDSKLFVLDANGALHALDLASKERLWISGGAMETLHLRSQSRPLAIADDLVIVGTPSGKVLMISQQDGVIINQIVVGQNNGSAALDRISDVSSTPLLLGDNMYTTAYNAGFVNYNFKENAVTARLAYHSSKDLAFDDNYFILTGDNGHIYCVRRKDNVEVWENSSLTYRNVSAPAIYGNLVVVGDYEGYVYFLDLENGNILTKIEVSSSPIYVAPLVYGSNLIVYSSSGTIESLHYDPVGLVASKQAYIEAEHSAGTSAALMAAKNIAPLNQGVVTKEALEKRRAEARQLVARIDAQQRRMEAEYREYQRRKAEYERRVKEYEKEKRERLSGYGLMVGEGVKSNSKSEFVEEGSE